MKCAKKFCPLFSYKVTPTAVASAKEHIYEQMTYNPAFTERNIQEANAYILDSRPEQKCLITYHHSIELVLMCLACQHLDFKSADWTSDNLHVMSS